MCDATTGDQMCYAFERESGAGAVPSGKTLELDAARAGRRSRAGATPARTAGSASSPSGRRVPGNPNIANCLSVGLGELCEGDGECGDEQHEQLRRLRRHREDRGSSPGTPRARRSARFAAQFSARHPAPALRAGTRCTTSSAASSSTGRRRRCGKASPSGPHVRRDDVRQQARVAVPPGSGYVEAKCDAGRRAACPAGCRQERLLALRANNDCPAFCRSRGQRSGFCGTGAEPNRCCICSQNGDGESNALSGARRTRTCATATASRSARSARATASAARRTA